MTYTFYECIFREICSLRRFQDLGKISAAHESFYSNVPLSHMMTWYHRIIGDRGKMIGYNAIGDINLF